MLLNDAIQSLSDQESAMDERPITERLMLSGDDTLLMAGRQLRLSDRGLERFCKQIAAPAEYLKRLDPDIRQVVLQRHVDRGEVVGSRLTIMSRGDEFLGFGRSDLLRISGREVLEAIRAGADKELEVHDLRFSNESAEADLLLENAAEEVAPGDVLRAGLRVTHSLIGDHATWIESYILRLVCSNGMTHRECSGRRVARTRRLPSDRQDGRQMQIAQVRRLASEATSALRHKLHAIRDLQRETVDVEQLLSRWLDRARLSSRTWLPILQEAWEVEGSQATAFGVMNAFTRVATHETRLSVRQRRILSGLAGVLAFQRIHICPRCFSQLGGPSSHVQDHASDMGATEEGVD